MKGVIVSLTRDYTPIVQMGSCNGLANSNQKLEFQKGGTKASLKQYFLARKQWKPVLLNKWSQ